MLIDQLIDELQQVAAAHGNIDVSLSVLHGTERVFAPVRDIRVIASANGDGAAFITNETFEPF